MENVILIHIGQAGIQIGNACWELFCIEHGVTPNGRKQNKCADDCSNETFFHRTSSGKFRARAVFVDLEPTVIDEIRNDVYQNLFSPAQFINGCEDAANNYARGYCTMGRGIVSSTMNAIRYLVEQCESFAGFLIFHSIGGGTGSGFTALLMESLAESYDKVIKLEFVVYPSPKLATSIVEPYNAVLNTHASISISDCVFLMDNEAIYEICSRQLLVNQPSYPNINRIIAQVVSSISSSLRFEGAINVDLMEFQTNLVPYPRIHFPLVGYAPFVPASSNTAEYLHDNNNNNIDRSTDDVTRITKQCLSADNQIVKCDPTDGSYISCCLLYRGTVSSNQITDSITSLRNNRDIVFVDWIPTGFKVGINYQPPTYVPGGDLAAVCNAVCVVANTTAIKNVWRQLRIKYERMYADRAFVHWYISEGMEEELFEQALRDIVRLEREYENIDEQSKTTSIDQISSATTTELTSSATTMTTNDPWTSSRPAAIDSDSRKGRARSLLDGIPFSTDKKTKL